ncbi:hypothetical protein [Aequorivita sp. CIP111184]|uniref:hypothetical protein n=1 Tax=Aequorivita sp. CIP111184 TaxID=2211356 RepID=UPI000DBBDB37|nr:hypothetical protein [Aequorivita sp. CIP111184]SRX55271.1 hypothetical protein AEQU1_02293 [Aequorivita sp. CIP111184]
MKTYTFAFAICVFLTLTMSGQKAAKINTPISSSGLRSHNPNIRPSHLVTCDGVLPNYTNAIPNSSRGVTSQDIGGN